MKRTRTKVFVKTRFLGLFVFSKCHFFGEKVYRVSEWLSRTIVAHIFSYPEFALIYKKVRKTGYQFHQIVICPQYFLFYWYKIPKILCKFAFEKA